MTPRAKHVLAWLAATAALLGVFALYTQPEMMVLMGDMIWACFN